jgi:cytoskeletal protein CcmA (bactofilin family)
MAANDDFSINTMVGDGSAFSGNLKVSGGLMVEGDIDGNIEISGNIIVGERARVRGNIVAKSAIISGVVIGDITAPDSIKLMSSSAVIGDVSTRKLQVAEKVVLHGHCISILEEERYENEFSVQSQSKEIRNKAFIR